MQTYVNAPTAISPVWIEWLTNEKKTEIETVLVFAKQRPDYWIFVDREDM